MDYLEGTYKNIKLEDSNIDVILPSVEWFLRRLENNDPFHHLRVNHATIDKYCWKFIPNLPEIPHNLGGVPTSLSNAIEFEKLDEFITLGKYEDIWKALLTQDSFSYFVEQNTVAEKLRTFVDVFHKYKDISPKFDIAVSLGVGLGPIWGRYYDAFPLQQGRKRVIDLITKKSKYPYFHSGALRHFGIMGELYHFFERINQMGFQIVFLGPEYLKLFEEEYKIENFHHIVTPMRRALDTYGDNLEEVKKIRDEKGKTILFHSTGHVAAGWIADYLKDDLDIWGIDIGRSFDWDIKNKVRKYPELVFPTKWTEVDKHQMVEHIKRLRNG